jgi:hypothetical protein
LHRPAVVTNEQRQSGARLRVLAERTTDAAAYIRRRTAPRRPGSSSNPASSPTSRLSPAQPRSSQAPLTKNCTSTRCTTYNCSGSAKNRPPHKPALRSPSPSREAASATRYTLASAPLDPNLKRIVDCTVEAQPDNRAAKPSAGEARFLCPMAAELKRREDEEQAYEAAMHVHQSEAGKHTLVWLCSKAQSRPPPPQSTTT